MPICPKCKSEYMPGSLICPDCNCELVDHLDDNSLISAISLKSPNVLKRFTDYLAYSGIETEVAEDGEKYTLRCDKKDYDRVMRAFSVFVSVETGNALSDMKSKVDDSSENELFFGDDDDLSSITESEDVLTALAEKLEDADIDENVKELLEEDSVKSLAVSNSELRKGTDRFEPIADKARDVRESALILTGIGVIGLVVFLLSVFGLFSFLPAYSNVVLLLLSIGMVAIGLESFDKYKEMLAKSDEETKYMNEIRDFLKESVSKETILAEYPDGDPADGEAMIETELLRLQMINKKITEQFPDCDDTMVVFLTEEWNTKLFGNE